MLASFLLSLREGNEAGVKGKPIIMTHGYEDSSMPLEWSHQSRDFLLQHGVDVEYHNFHMGHTITAESLARQIPQQGIARRSRPRR